MNDNPNFFARAGKKVKEYTLPALVIFPVMLLVFYYVFKYADRRYFSSHPEAFKELFGFALAILSGGIYLAVMKWFQFMGFFREEILRIVGSSEFDTKLQRSFYDVLYSDEFLKKQNDLEKIWKRVTRCYFKSEFPEDISDKVNSKLEEVFFHNNHLSHFFRNYIIGLTIDIDAEGFLTITEISDVRIIRPGPEKFAYDFSYFITLHSLTDDVSDIKFNYLKVNNKPIDLTPLVTSEGNGLELTRKALIQLDGLKEYQVLSKVTLKYHIQTDPEYKFFSERVIDYVRTTIKYPSKKLDIFFLPIGNESFTDREAPEGELVKIYDDLLLPEKGFRLIFVKTAVS